jgi:hypothetical protein
MFYRIFSDINVIILHKMDFKTALIPFSEVPLTKQVLLELLKEYKRPFDKINELGKQGILVMIKNGLYVPGPASLVREPEPFLLANHIWGPSYVSLESAMSYWGLIPERVYEISSVTTMLSKTYNTSTGRYSYIHMSSPYYAMGIQQRKLSDRQHILIASPEKSVCDKVVATSGILLRSKKQVLDLLLEDFRISEDRLKSFNTEEMKSWLPFAPKKSSLEILINTISQL